MFGDGKDLRWERQAWVLFYRLSHFSSTTNTLDKAFPKLIHRLVPLIYSLASCLEPDISC